MKNTLVVVGAGASHEFGLPIGTGLQETIQGYCNIKFRGHGADRDSGDHQIYHCAKVKFPDRASDILAAARRIHDGVLTASSIDGFLDNHQNDNVMRQVGVLSIAKAIVRAERESSLHISQSNRYNRLQFQRLQETWLLRLFKVMSRGRPKNQLKEFFSRVSFVIFNYDRCVEHFLFWALQAHYSVSEQEAVFALNEAKIVHPYGTIGRLSWQSGSGPTVRFGGEQDDQNPLVEMADGIRTYTDQLDDENKLMELRRMVMGADLIYFLGFSYQPQNLSLLSTGGKATDVIGSAYEVSEYDRSRIQDDIRGKLHLTGVRFHLEDKKCAEMLQRYSRAFT